MVLPDPLQFEQVIRAKPTEPPVGRACTVTPSPSHRVHFLGLVLGLPPVPLHVEQTTAFSIWNLKQSVRNKDG